MEPKMDSHEFTEALNAFQKILEYQPNLLRTMPISEDLGKSLANMSIAFIKEFHAQRNSIVRPRPRD